jgi:hypothetical protein
MKVEKIVRDENFVLHKSTDDARLMGRDKRAITSYEAPIPSFEEALDALTPVACNILGLGKDYGDDAKTRSVTISYSKRGTRSCQLQIKKEISATQTTHLITTPKFQFDDAQEGEHGQMECSKAQKKVIEAFIAEAVKYIGDAENPPQRLQRLLPLVQAEPTDGEELPGVSNA